MQTFFSSPFGNRTHLVIALLNPSKTIQSSDPKCSKDEIPYAQEANYVHGVATLFTTHLSFSFREICCEIIQRVHGRRPGDVRPIQ